MSRFSLQRGDDANDGTEPQEEEAVVEEVEDAQQEESARSTEAFSQGINALSASWHLCDAEEPLTYCRVRRSALPGLVVRELGSKPGSLPVHRQITQYGSVSHCFTDVQPRT